MKKRSNALPAGVSRAVSRGRRPALCAVALALALLGAAGGAQAQEEPFIAEMRLFAMPWCPIGWAQAAGQIMAINVNQPAFTLLGATYGGNGQTNFALPDLRGRAPIGRSADQGYVPGQTGGVETVVITNATMPMHSHGQIASTAAATHAAPGAGSSMAQAQNAGLYAQPSAGSTVGFESGMVGGSLPVSVRNPYLVMTWCIAMQGAYPPSSN